ncbi:MAG: hypothetical protein CM1200mP20_16110 [Pseudomonadota bacterium]|nr:MAG: hypothetical protein CM1200mP20_16110 [Pseudomonadota bacterium]
MLAYEKLEELITTLKLEPGQYCPKPPWWISVHRTYTDSRGFAGAGARGPDRDPAP